VALVPATNGTLNLGTTNAPWNDVFALDFIINDTFTDEIGSLSQTSGPTVTLQALYAGSYSNAAAGVSVITAATTENNSGNITLQTGNSQASNLIYEFSASFSVADVGATYTNNGQTFTVLNTVTNAFIWASGTGAPLSAGTLTRTSGTGDNSITYSTVTTRGYSGNVVIATGTAPTGGQGNIQLNAPAVIGAASTTPQHSLNTATATGSGTSTLGSTNSPGAATPVGWISIIINGTTQYIPYF
jgi:hypothetical protein